MSQQRDLDHEQIVIRLRLECFFKLQDEAQRRRIAPGTLGRRLLEAAIEDNLIVAILDDDEHQPRTKQRVSAQV